MSIIRFFWPLVSGALLTAAIFAPPANANAVYNVVTDFSSGSNPNGVWTYQVSGTPYPLSDGFFSSCNAAPNSCAAWSTFLSAPNGASMLANLSGFALDPNSTTVVPANYLNIDPQGLSNQIVFTAPSGGTWQVVGQFLGNDMVGNAHPVSVSENGATSLFRGTIASFGQTAAFDVDVNLNTGDTITFDVGTGSSGCSFCFLSTGLWAEVTTSLTPIAIPEPDLTPSLTATPEPEMFPLLGAGLAGLALIQFRRRDKHQA